MRFSLLLAFLLLTAPARAADLPPPAELTLPQIFAELRARHPALAAARAATEAARARVYQESAWMDPRVGFEHMRDDTRLGDYSELKLSVAQEIPLSGRNRARARAAEAETAVVATQALHREWLLLNQARTAFVRLAAADERLAVNRRLRELLAQTTALARRAYESGLGEQAGLLALETELARLDADAAELSAMRAQEGAMLNALLLRPADSPLPDLALPEPAPPAIPLAEAVARARAASPEISLALREADAAQARLAIAQKNRAIDPELMVAARRMKGMGGDLVTAYDTGLSFSLPWLNPGRTRAELAEARGRLASARAEADAAEAEVAGLVASAHARAASAHEQVRRQRDDILPLARSSVEAARRDYESGRSALAPALDAERAALDAEMKLADLRAAHALAAAELAFLTSQDLAQ